MKSIRTIVAACLTYMLFTVAFGFVQSKYQRQIKIIRNAPDQINTEAVVYDTDPMPPPPPPPPPKP